MFGSTETDSSEEQETTSISSSETSPSSLRPDFRLQRACPFSRKPFANGLWFILSCVTASF